MLLVDSAGWKAVVTVDSVNTVPSSSPEGVTLALPGGDSDDAPVETSGVSDVGEADVAADDDAAPALPDDDFWHE